MLFSSPDYPIFLIAVFFLYALARWSGDARAAWARIGVMVLLADVVFMLVAKDPDTLWDPIGGVLLRLAAADGRDWPPWLFGHWAVGAIVLAGAVATGRAYAAWIASDAGQRVIARVLVGVLAAGGIGVALAAARGSLDAVTEVAVASGHLVVLAILGVGLGLSRAQAQRSLGRVVVLFVASSLFYHAWAAAMPGVYRYLLGLLLATIALDYYLGLWIERTEGAWQRKALVIVSLCSNLGILMVFKYADFFTHDVLGLGGGRLNLILPAGISFHTFQSLSYTIDVYRRELPATRSVVQFATFVLFFPQLVAGPIVRAQDLLPQLAAPPPLELAKATHGLFRIVVGLFKKIALADTLALSIVDRVFEAPQRFSAVEVLVGVYGYALQIYLDFSAYSDIAIGSAQVLGFELPENFRTPYRSANLQEFWRRWHISLSTWLRDYLYIALGGSRRSAARTYVNLIITMVLGGLWHGASWVFVVWGALHGFGLAVTRYCQRRAKARASAIRLAAACALIAVVGLVAQRVALREAGIWSHLVVAWLTLTPLWAVLTAWLGRDVIEAGPAVVAPAVMAEALRLAMCASAIGVVVALVYGESWTWLPVVALTWALAGIADVVEAPRASRALTHGRVRRAIAAVLVFHYVCLAWIFFRAPTFDDALAVLRQLALLETDHANVVPVVTLAVVVGFACHYFPDGTFRWLRVRFTTLPSAAQGAVLAGCALVLRELAHPTIVPFIYFQF